MAAKGVVRLGDKVMWNRDAVKPPPSAEIGDFVSRKNLAVETVVYGNYTEQEYRRLLGRSRGMIFRCEHESQGTRVSRVPIQRRARTRAGPGTISRSQSIRVGQPNIAATSVPYFDNRCGERFKGLEDSDEKLSMFEEKIDASAYRPRDLLLENLTLS
jgi:hypothetical protein